MALRNKSRIFFWGAVLLFLPAAALAEGYPDVDDYGDDGFGMDLSVYGIFSVAHHDFGVGAGAQFAYPLLPSGIFAHPRHRDALHVEGGLDFYYWDSVSLALFAPHAGLRYAVYITTPLALLVSLKGGVGFDDGGDSVAFFWNGSAGAMWDLSDLLSLRAEFGWGRYSDVFRVGALLRF